MPDSRLFSDGKTYFGRTIDTHLVTCAFCGDSVYRRKVVWYGKGIEIEPGTNVKRPVEEWPACPDCAHTLATKDHEVTKVVLGARAVQKLVDAKAPQWEIDAAVKRWGLEGLV